MQEQAIKVVLVEDDPDISRLLQINLSHLGYQLLVAEDGASGLALILASSPDLVILDVMLPKLDGLSVCRHLREQRVNVPILMLTARTEEADKILGLEVGADDYLTKPFSIGELLARVRALLRRFKGSLSGGTDGASKSEGGIIKMGELRLDLNKRLAFLREQDLQLTFKEFELLQYLFQNPGKSFTRMDLLAAVWEYEFEGYEHTVTSHINRLRRKIEREPANPDYIKTVRGAGYRFATDDELTHLTSE